MRSPMRPRRRARGSTSTARSGSGQPHRRRSGTSRRARRADSWATDAHKWLNVPYDIGIAFCAHPDSHRAALGIRSAYLIHADPDAARDPVDWNPEHSRRARAIHDLRRAPCARPQRRCRPRRPQLPRRAALAAGLSELPGCEILNDVVLNQVLLPLRGRRDDRSRGRSSAGERRGLAGRHRLGRSSRHPDLGVELADERGRRRTDDRCVRRGALQSLIAPCEPIFRRAR